MRIPCINASYSASLFDGRGKFILNMYFILSLRERGLRLLYDAPRRGTAGSLINFIHPSDAGGVLVELVQAAPRG